MYKDMNKRIEAWTTTERDFGMDNMYVTQQDKLKQEEIT